MRPDADRFAGGLTKGGDVMRAWVERHDTVAFVFLTFGFSWPMWMASSVLNRTPVRAPDLSWWVAQIGVWRRPSPE
jgi:hypothetical protein